MAKGQGISINLISLERLEALNSQQKIRFIFEEVRKGNVLVLEQGLTAQEEAELIKTTMANIDHDTFIGIEMQSYSQEDVKRGSWLDKLLGRKQPPRMSVIGPADLLKTIHKDGNMIQTMVLTKESIVGEEKKAEKVLPPPPKDIERPSPPTVEEKQPAQKPETTPPTPTEAPPQKDEQPSEKPVTTSPASDNAPPQKESEQPTEKSDAVQPETDEEEPKKEVEQTAEKPDASPPTIEEGGAQKEGEQPAEKNEDETPAQEENKKSEEG
jgi:hypothetical protein